MTTKTKSISALVLVILVVIVGGGIWWFLHDDSPPPVDLDAAAKGVTSTTAAPGGTASPDGSKATAGIEGTWKVDTTTGTFDYQSASGTFVGYRVQENLARVGSNTAVGRTNAVKGTMEITGTKVTSADLTVDMTKLASNDDTGFRDGKVQQALETDRFPTATFELTEPIELGADAATGSQVDVTAMGDLTVHGVTRPVQFPLQAKLVNGTVVVVGSIPVAFADFGVKVPSAPVVLSVDDHGTLELQLLFEKA